MIAASVACRLVAGDLVLAQGSGSTTGTAERAAAAHAAPGDRFVFKLLGELLPIDTTLVNERGQVAVYKLGMVDVSSMPISQIHDTLTAQLAKKLVDPVIDVTILRRVVVNGAVQHPDVYYVDLSSRVADVIARAGGVTDVGDDHKVLIVRDGQGLAVPDWQHDFTAVADLRSGDQVVVGRRSWLAINAFQVASVVFVVASLLLSLHH